VEIIYKFDETMNSKNLYELADRLQDFVERVKRSKLKKRTIAESYILLNEHCGHEDNEHAYPFYKIVSESESIPEFLHKHWSFRDEASDDIKQLESIVEMIRSRMQPPQAPRISDHTIHDLMNLAEKKFKYCSKVLESHPLKILCINQTHKDWGCYYMAGTLDGMIVNDGVIMTCPQNPELHQEFGFMHELGHRLHTSLTGKSFVPPASFSYFRDYLPEHTQDDRSMSEHFANFFAIAALNDTPYEYCIKHEVSAKDRQHFEQYMMLTIMTMDENVIQTITDLDL
jgi:hypothetical protein